MLVQMVDELEHVAFHRSRYGDVVNKTIMTKLASVNGSRAADARRSAYLRWMTYSHRPTPPACGQTGTPNLVLRRQIVWVHEERVERTWLP